MAQKRRHSVVVDITLDDPCTEKRAARTVLDMMNAGSNGYRVTRMDTKMFTRATQHMKRCKED